MQVRGKSLQPLEERLHEDAGLVTGLTGGRGQVMLTHPILALREELRRLNAVHDAILTDRTLTMVERRQLAAQTLAEIRGTSAAIVLLQREALHG